jgi:hypothetical protein
LYLIYHEIRGKYIKRCFSLLPGKPTNIIPEYYNFRSIILSPKYLKKFSAERIDCKDIYKGGKSKNFLYGRSVFMTIMLTSFLNIFT